MRLKIFRNKDKNDLEKEANNWMNSGQFDIFKVLQSETIEGITISIFYKESC